MSNVINPSSLQPINLIDSARLVNAGMRVGDALPCGGHVFA